MHNFYPDLKQYKLKCVVATLFNENSAKIHEIIRDCVCAVYLLKVIKFQLIFGYNNWINNFDNVSSSYISIIQQGDRGGW